MKLLAIDGNSIINRAFYGIKLLSAKDGTFTNGIYGFLNILFKLLDDVNPDAVAAAFDLRAPTFRHKKYDKYKAGRKGMPDELAEQLPILKDILKNMGYTVLECEGYEADDIIGTLAVSAFENGGECYIATGDRDTLQLVNDKVCVMLASTKYGRPETTVYDAAKIKEKYDLNPPQLIDVKALMGDSSDNIPGVAGIGEKTALSLISQFGTLDGVYENIDSESIKESVRNKLAAGKDSAYMSYELGRICTSVPDISASMCKKSDRNDAELSRILTRLEMYKIMERMGLSPSVATENIETSEKLEFALIKLSEISEMPPSVKDVLFGRNARDNQTMQKGASSGAGDAKALNGLGNMPKPNSVQEPTRQGKEAHDAEIGLNTAAHPYTDTEMEAYVYVSWAGSEIAAAAVCISGTVYLLKGAAAKEFFEKCRAGLSVHDAKPLIKIFGESIKISFDTMLAAYLLNPSAHDYSLKRLAAEYSVELPKVGGRDMDDTASEQLSFGDISTAEEYDDIIFGSALLAAVAMRLKSEISAQSMNSLLYDVEIPLSYVLADMENVGVRVDAEGIREYGAILGKEIEALQSEIYNMVGYEFNLNSPKQLSDALFVKLGLHGKKKTKSGYSTDVEVLQSLIDEHPVIEKILYYRQISKLKSTYCDGLLKVIGDDGRIHSSFNQTETRTGRISSTEPNLQNIPVRQEIGREMRKFFTASTGCLLCDADYSQIELRVLAGVSGDKAMTEAFKNGTDIHTVTASQVFGVPENMVTPLMRSRAKAVNFGIVYGIGAFSLSKDIHVSFAEAKNYIDAYNNTYSGVSAYMERAVETAKEKGYAETALGRRRYLPELKSSSAPTRAFGERVARNMPIQGTAADIIKIAMVRVYNRLKNEGLKSRLILQVHDELIVEAHMEEKDRVVKILGEEMCSAYDMNVPLIAEVHTGENWLEAKD